MDFLLPCFHSPKAAVASPFERHGAVVEREIEVAEENLEEARSVEGPEPCSRSSLPGGVPSRATEEEGHTNYNIGDGNVACVVVVERGLGSSMRRKTSPASARSITIVISDTGHRRCRIISKKRRRTAVQGSRLETRHRRRARGGCARRRPTRNGVGSG